MKKLFILSSVSLFALGSAAYAASATGTANIRVAPQISIAVANNLEFGSVTTDGTAGTVNITTGGSSSATGGVTLISSGTTRAAGAFNVTGEANATYTITLPSSINLSDGASHTITIDNFQSNPSNNGTLSAGGTQTLNVGARANLGTSQAIGSYTGTYQVTVAYN